MVIAQGAQQPVIEATLRRVLARDAELLAAARPTPVDLKDLLDDLGISLVGERPTGSHSAHGSLRRVDGMWQIVTNAATADTRQRYTIAHEIGHYLIEARVGFRPGSPREYWMVEELCQVFAANLLCPRRLIEEALSSRPRTPADLLFASDWLMAAASLSIEAAVRRVVETIDIPVAVGALSIEREDVARPAKPRIGTLMWLHANRSWIPPGRGQSIRKDHVLNRVLAEARQLPIGGRAAVELPGAESASVERRGQAFSLMAAVLQG
jgi:hypothetical protein